MIRAANSTPQKSAFLYPVNDCKTFTPLQIFTTLSTVLWIITINLLPPPFQQIFHSGIIWLKQKLAPFNDGLPLVVMAHGSPMDRPFCTTVSRTLTRKVELGKDAPEVMIIRAKFGFVSACNSHCHSSSFIMPCRAFFSTKNYTCYVARFYP